MVKEPKKRKVKDFRKSIRKHQPEVADDIDQLVKKFRKSADYRNFKKRFARR